MCTEPIEVNFENEEIVLIKCKKVAVKDLAQERLVHTECFEAIQRSQQPASVTPEPKIGKKQTREADLEALRSMVDSLEQQRKRKRVC